ncbi:hypothetical protein [Pseudomonas putida]
MPIDLNMLPAKKKLPLPPKTRCWVTIILLCCLLGSSLTILFWPEELKQMSLWRWCSMLLLPLIAGFLLFAFRGIVYQRQCDFVKSWNHRHAEHEQRLIQQGQRAIALLATSYSTPAGNNQLAYALRSGSKPLQPVYLHDMKTVRMASQLPDAGTHDRANKYGRLQMYLHQVMRGLEDEMQRYGGYSPLRLRIKHNHVLSDDEVVAVWHSCAMDKLSIETLQFAAQDDGVLWLDEWLDQPDDCALMLSLEINLFVEPLEGQAESVSALILAQPYFCEQHGFAATAWIHRPVPMSDNAQSLREVLRWGRLGEDSQPYFVWQTQVPNDYLCRVTIAMSSAGQSLDKEKYMQLDRVLGKPADAVGNLAIIVASEQAAAEDQSQLIMMQDKTPQWFVVRPASHRGASSAHG